MFEPNFSILYVKDPISSAAFYTQLLGISPFESQATFVLFVFPSGLKLGLWKQDGVIPSSSAKGGTSELAITLKDKAEVDALAAAWTKLGVEIIQAPVQLDFGYTFTAKDHDEHRLRVFVPG